jgi:zinc protease
LACVSNGGNQTGIKNFQFVPVTRTVRERFLSLKWNVKRLAVLAGISIAMGPLACAQSAATASSDSKTTPATGASAPASAPALTADQILENYIKAIGGRENWKKLTTRISTGTIDVPAMNLSGLVTVREKAPNRSIFTVNFNGAVFQQGFDGTIGWSNDPQNGLREQAGEELAETKRDSDFYHPLDLKQMYSKITLTGTDKIDDRDAYIVEASSADLGTDKIYFDTQNGLVLRIVGQHHTMDGPATFTEDFSDFREVDGIKLPYTVHQESPSSTFTIKFTEIRHNEAIEDAAFAKPAAH